MGIGPSSCTAVPSAAPPSFAAEGTGARAVSLAFAAAATLRPRVLEQLKLRPDLYAPADEAIREGKEYSARRNSWGGVRTGGAPPAGGRAGRVGGGVHFEAFPGLPPDLQGRASVACLRIILKAAPEEVQKLLGRPVINADDPRISGYVAQLREGVREYEARLKELSQCLPATGLVDDEVISSRIDNRYGWLLAAGVTEPIENTLVFAAAGLSPQVGARTLFGVPSAEHTGRRAQFPPATVEEKDGGDHDGYESDGDVHPTVRRHDKDIDVLSLHLSGRAAHDSRAVELLLRSQPLLRPLKGVSLEIRCCGAVFACTSQDPCASIHFQCGSAGCAKPGLVLCHCEGTLSHATRFCEECDRRIHTYKRPTCKRLSLFFTSTGGAYQLPAVLPVPPNYFLPQGSRHFLKDPSQLVFSIVPAPCDVPLLPCDCGSCNFVPHEWDKSCVTMAGLEASFIGARVTKFKCINCGNFVRPPSGAVQGAGEDAIFGMLSGAQLAPSSGARTHTLYANGSLDVLRRLNASLPSGVPANAAAATLFPGEARHVDTTRIAVNASYQASSLSALVVEASPCLLCPINGVVHLIGDGNLKCGINKKLDQFDAVYNDAPPILGGGVLLDWRVVKECNTWWDQGKFGANLAGFCTGCGGTGANARILAGDESRGASERGRRVGGLYVLGCRHRVAHAAWPLVNGKGEGYLHVVMALIMCCALGSRHFQCDTLCIALSLLRSRGQESSTWATPLLHILFPALYNFELSFVVGDYAGPTPGCILRVNISPAAACKAPFPLPLVRIEGRGLLVHDALSRIVGEHLISCSIPILHAFGHQCDAALGAAHVPGAWPVEALEELNRRLSLRADSRRQMKLQGFIDAWNFEFASHRLILAEDPACAALHSIIDAGRAFLERLELLHGALRFHGSAPGAAPGHDYLGVSDALGKRIDDAAAASALKAQGGPGGFHVTRDPLVGILRNMDAVAKKEAVVAALDAIVLKHKDNHDPAAFLHTVHNSLLPPKLASQCQNLDAAVSLLKVWTEKLVFERGALRPLEHDEFVRGLCVAVNETFYQRAYFRARLATASTKASALEVDLLSRRVRKLSEQLDSYIKRFNSAFAQLPVQQRPPGIWRNAEDSWRVPPVDKWATMTPAEVLPPHINGVDLSFAQPLWDLIYKRNFARRAYERLAQCVQDLSSVEAHLALHTEQLQRVVLWLQQPLSGTMPEFSFAPTIIGTVKEVARGVLDVPLVLPSKGHGLFLLSLVVSAQERNRVALKRTARAAAALSQWRLEDANSLELPWRPWPGCAVLPLLPCPHRAATLKYSVRGLLEDKYSPAQWLRLRLRGTNCGCRNPLYPEFAHNSDDDGGAEEEGEGEGGQHEAQRVETLPEQLGSTDSEDEMAAQPRSPSAGHGEGAEAGGAAGARSSAPEDLPEWLQQDAAGAKADAPAPRSGERSGQPSRKKRRTEQDGARRSSRVAERNEKAAGGAK
jgi:hypothetical protein